MNNVLCLNKRLTFCNQGPVQKASIELKQVHIPVCKCLSICFIVTQTARVSSTRIFPNVCIDSKFQTFRMDLTMEKTHLFRGKRAAYLSVLASRWQCGTFEILQTETLLNFCFLIRFNLQNA